MEFRVLGPLEVRVGGQPVVLRRQKHRALLVDLLLSAGEVVSTDRLLDDLWGERPPPTAKTSLQNSVSQLRKLLGSDALRTQAPGYLLDVEPDRVDLLRFERLLDEARSAGSADRRAAKLREALALWRGPPLADLAFEPFAQVEVARLEELRTEAEEELIEAELELGRAAELVARLEALVAEYPLRERLRGQLMLALYRAGRQAEALEAYQEARRTLTEELGLEPSPALRTLEQAILRQDPALAQPSEPAERPPARPGERRKTVTVLFSDVVSSTELGESLDPEALRGVMARYFGEMRAAIEYHGGTVEKFAGDEVMAVFGVPETHEDDALRAVRAAAAMREALTALNVELERERGLRLEARTGLNTGEVVASDGGPREPFVTGDPVNVGKRLEQAAPAGEILIGAATLRLVRDAVSVEAIGPVELRGKARPLPAFRLVEVRPGAASPARHLEAPMVGRERELERLRAAFAEVERGRGCRVLTILGEAGIGKSRLAGELVASLADGATVLVGRCVPYGEGATYLPLKDVVGGAVPEASQESLGALLAGEEEGELVARRVAELVGLAEGPGSSGEAFWATRRFLEALARTRPLVLVFEDVHWAEPTFLDLVDYLAGWSSDAPILVVCVARPELLEKRPEWAASTIELEPLDDTSCEQLVVNLADVPPELRARVVRSAEGNPLFAEQLLALASEEGGALADVPPSLEALLASRLDRLEPDERAVLQRAAVVGREFWRGAVVDLLPHEHIPSVGRHLLALARKGLVHPGRSALPREDVFRFHHALIRDVAYAGIPKELRADLHERHADWLEEHSAGPDELVGYHLEQAARFCTELGAADGRARRLAGEAGAKLGAAGIRAWKRVDAPATVNLLGRAIALLPEDSPSRRELLCELGIALRMAGESEQASEVLNRAIKDSLAAHDRGLELRARIELEYSRLLSEPEATTGDLIELAESAIPTFEALDDDRSLGRSWLLVGFVRGGLLGHDAAREEAVEKALSHYRRSGWPTSTCIGELVASLYFGPTPVPRAIDRCRSLLQDASTDRTSEANVIVFLGGLEAMRGNFDEARSLVERARRTYEELGHVLVTAAYWGAVASYIELLGGNYASAEALLGEMYEASQTTRNSTWAGELAEVTYAQGRYDEAERWTRLSEEHALRDDVEVQIAWRSVRAKTLARRGMFREAESLALDAIRLADDTDKLNLRAKVQLDMAEVLILQTRVGEAIGFIERAVNLNELKGNVIAVAKARSLLNEPALA